ncbi:MAG TPA: LCP family protein [Armatimonadota bacterium]|nr:LCP family protein [Armatimonadota bacterium]
MSNIGRIAKRENVERRAGKTGRLFRRVLKLLLLMIVIVAGIGASLFSYYYCSSRTFKDTVSVLLSGAEVPEKAFPGRTEVNILLMGRDLDRDRCGRVVNTHGRTDAMMLAHIDFRKRSADILSIPRDTLVRIPGYRGKRRISYANALGGPELARRTISEFLGVYPDHYLLVNFDGFEKAIDDLGGLAVTVGKRLDYDDSWGNLHIHLKAGKRVLNGEQCMGFVRYRQSNNGEGESDFVRIGRQQEFLRAARAKLSSPGVMFRLPEVLDTIREDIEGNLTLPQVICLARFIKALPPGSEIRMETLPALDGGGVFVRADLHATRELLRQMFFDNQR